MCGHAAISIEELAAHMLKYEKLFEVTAINPLRSKRIPFYAFSAGYAAKMLQHLEDYECFKAANPRSAFQSFTASYVSCRSTPLNAALKQAEGPIQKPFRNVASATIQTPLDWQKKILVCKLFIYCFSVVLYCLLQYFVFLCVLLCYDSTSC